MNQNPKLLDRAASLIDEELLDAYWEAVEEFDTTDLVLILNVDDDDGDVLKACTRSNLLKSDDVPPFLLQKVAQTPTSDPFPSVSFWLFVAFEGGEVVCLGVSATFMSKGGDA